MENVPRKHQMLVCRMTLVIKKWKRVKAEARNKWWKLRKNERCRDFREELTDDWVSTE